MVHMTLILHMLQYFFREELISNAKDAVLDGYMYFDIYPSINDLDQTRSFLKHGLSM